MPNEKIVEYYLLCSLAGKYSHMMGDLAADELSVLLTSREREEFLKSMYGRVVANEMIIGGDNEDAQADDPDAIVIMPATKSVFKMDPFQTRFRGGDDVKCIVIE